MFKKIVSQASMEIIPENRIESFSPVKLESKSNHQSSQAVIPEKSEISSKKVFKKEE